MALRTFSTMVFCVWRYCVCCALSVSKARALSACAERLRIGREKFTPAGEGGNLFFNKLERAVPQPLFFLAIGRIWDPTTSFPICSPVIESIIGSLGIGSNDVGVVEVDTSEFPDRPVALYCT